MRDAWLAAITGAFLCFVLTDAATLDPRNTGWLMRGDPATAFLGWHFFRQAPMLQAPFGANPGYGMEMGSSIVFSDSIPLLAFAFKPIAGVLPAAFQYFGLWILLSFVLQSLLAYLLLRRFSSDRWLPLAGSAFFALAPVYLARLDAHFALFGQWLVLGALVLYFAPRFYPWRWLGLLSLAVLVHFHFLAMIGLLWAGAELWQRRWRGEINTLQAAAHLSGGALAIAALMWLAGYFMVGGSIGEPGFGVHRMNLLSPVDPQGPWSALLPDLPGGTEREGFNYLGIGMLLLALLAAISLLARAAETAIDRRSIVPLLVVSLAFTLLALSNRVAVGGVELFAYDVPGLLRPFADALRSSGRMFWPVYYLIYVAVFAVLFRRLAPRVALAACALLLAVHAADSWTALRQVRGAFVDPAAWSSPLKSRLWPEMARLYKRVAYVLPRNAPDAFLPWAAYAADHRMAVNFGYFARVNAEKLEAARQATARELLDGRLDRETLYVFENEALWTLAASRIRPGDLAAVVDGFRIIAPHLRECAACDLRALADARTEEPHVHPMGESISFGSAATGARHALMGWSTPEDWGTWSDAPAASVLVRLARSPQRDALLTIEARAFVNHKHPTQEIAVSVNRVGVGTLRYASAEMGSRTLRIPRAALHAGDGLVLIEFRLKDAKSPRELGLDDDDRRRLGLDDDDRRRLGLGLISLRLSEA